MNKLYEAIHIDTCSNSIHPSGWGDASNCTSYGYGLWLTKLAHFLPDR